jgi:hypothetical protein
MNRVAALALWGFGCIASSLVAQSVDWYRAGAAGGEATAGGIRLRGASGQAEASVATGGGYRLTGGFWHPAALGLSGAGLLEITGLTLDPASGTPGTSVHARGAVTPAGVVALSAYWQEGGVLRLVGRGMTGANGAFDLPLTVPADAGAGAAQIALLAGEGAPDQLASTGFEVLAAPLSRLSGVVRNAMGSSVGAGVEVRLVGQDGLNVGATVTDGGGRFVFDGVSSGPHRVQVTRAGYPPETVGVVSGQNLEFEVNPADLALPEWPPVMLISAGAVALPGGSYSGNQPVQVGEWTDAPMARLVSLKGKSLPPLTVRFWAEIQRILLPPDAPLLVVFELRKGGQAVAPQVVTDTLATVYPEGKLNVPAFTADFNSLELTPGKLTLVVGAFTTMFTEVGWWEFPVEVVNLGNRWYAGNVKEPKLTVTRKDFFELRYEFNGTLPGGLPGVGTPLFDEPLDLEFKTLQNRFNLGIALTERFHTGGGWTGQAQALAELTLLDTSVINESRALNLHGNTLPTATYTLPPWMVPLPGGQCVSIWGAAMPNPIDICGLKFNGQVGIVLCFDGQVGLGGTVHTDLRTTATVTPALNVSLPVGATIEAAICDATANITPKASLSAPIILDPGHSPPVYWDGLCLSLSGKANVGLSCCGLGFNKSVDLFDPIEIGNCPSQAQLHGLLQDETAMAPPRHASLAFSPAGYAVAVWENHETIGDTLIRTAPVYSLFDGTTWTLPTQLAGPEYAGWEPKVAFVDDLTATFVWVVPGTDESPALSAFSGPHPHGVCDSIGDLVEFGCSLVKGAVTVVKSICFFCSEPAGDELDPIVLGAGPGLNVRPVLATNPENGDAVVLWLREQEPIPGDQQALALYFSRLSNDGWSLPQRVDPASNFFDLQPSLRFDRQGRPSVVWVRDFDGDLGTPEDRFLVFSQLESAWSTPEVLAALPPAPWTPSLDFDQDNQPVVAFVVPASNPRTGALLGADGLLSTLHVARRSGPEWLAQPVGPGTRAERPVLRVNSDNHALIFFRAFELAGQSTPSGEIGSAVADLAELNPRWGTGSITTDRQWNRPVTAELNPVTGEPLLLWETLPDLGAEPQMRSAAQPWAVDLAPADPGLTFSEPHPIPGQSVDISARVGNLGLRSLAANFLVNFYDGDPERGGTPFATRTLDGPLGLGETLLVTVEYTPVDRAWRTFYVVVDADDTVPESDETNNRLATAWGGLTAPVHFTATPLAGTGAVRLDWVNPTAAGNVRYWISRTHTGTGAIEWLGATHGEEFVDTTALEGEEYAYRLVAFDGSGVRSTTTATGSFTVPGPEPPDPELLRLRAVPFAGAVSFSWNALPAVQLETAGELGGDGTQWLPVTEGIERFGGVAQFTLPAVQGQRFFRLVQP